MALICAAISRLVAEVMPEQITMETYYANLPSEALKKYDVIGAKIIAAGYVVGDAFRHNDGVNYWLFKKRN